MINPEWISKIINNLDTSKNYSAKIWYYICYVRYDILTKIMKDDKDIFYYFILFSLTSLKRLIGATCYMIIAKLHAYGVKEYITFETVILLSLKYKNKEFVWTTIIVNGCLFSLVCLKGLYLALCYLIYFVRSFFIPLWDSCSKLWQQHPILYWFKNFKCSNWIRECSWNTVAMIQR